MKRERYDANPDVDEVMHYSGAGAAARQRKDEALWKITEASLDRMRDEWAESEREEARSDRRFVAGLLAALSILAGLLWLAVGP